MTGRLPVRGVRLQVGYVVLTAHIHLSAFSMMESNLWSVQVTVCMLVSPYFHRLRARIELIFADGSSQTTGIVQNRNQGRMTPWDRHPDNGRRSKTSNITPVRLGAVTEHLFPFLPLKE